MSDHIPADLYIGGPLATSLLPALVALLVNYSTDDSQEEFSEEIIRELATTNDVLHVHDHNADNGEFPALEAFCIQHSLDFCRTHEAKFEYDAESVVRLATEGDGLMHVGLVDRSGEQVLRLSDMLEVCPVTNDWEAMGIRYADYIKRHTLPSIRPLSLVDA